MTSNDSNEYFLGRGGEIFGPYTKVEVDSMKTSGEFQKYSWFWGPQNESWVAINPPPKPPIQKRGGAASLAESEVRSQLKPSSKSGAGSPPPTPGHEEFEIVATRLQAICIADHRMISGIVSEATSQGFLLTSKDFPDMIPPFSKGSQIKINLLDDVSGFTENHLGTFTGLGRKNNHWELHIKWNSLPKLLTR